MSQGFAEPESKVTVRGGNGGSGTGADADAIHDNVASEIALIEEKTSPVGADLVIIEDSAALNQKKRVQITNLPGGADADAIHDNVAGEIVAVTEKVTPVGADVILIEDSAAGDAKKRVQITNLPTGSDSDAIHDNVASEISALTSVGAASGDHILIEDVGDSNNKKRVTAQSIADLGAGGADGTAIHDNVAGEIVLITEKASPVAADLVLIEDSADSNNKKRVQITNLPTGSDPAAIHDDTASEISAITAKALPIDADFLLIEDSEAADVKKRVTLGQVQGRAQAESGTVTLDVGHSFVLAESDGGAFVVTIPQTSATGINGISYYIKRDGSNNVTLRLSGADLFNNDGVTSAADIVLSADGDHEAIVGLAGEWHQL